MANVTKPIALDETLQRVASATETIKNNIQYVKGDPGDDYVITENDYNEIAEVTKPKVITAIQPEIQEIEAIAKGANQALSYANYQSMITAFNSLEDDVYNVGQNVMIVTLNVPDLWISSVESTSVAYTYTTDEAFMNDLATNGYVQIGYYRLSALETQKVDLTNYYTKSATDNLLNDKANTSDVNTELAKKVNNADVEEKDLLVTYEDETTETLKLVVYK